MVIEDGRSTSFGVVAEQYDRSRPSYPSELIDDLVGGGTPTVVDVGCGTGIAARLFAARGCAVLGVEPDVRMAEVARRSGLAVVVSRFEDWDADERYDLVVSGQAWHWVDSLEGSAKAAAILRPGGRFAAFWNGYEHEPAFQEVCEATYRVHAPELLEDSVALGRHRVDLGNDPDAAALRATGPFVDIERRRYTWSRVHSAQSWIEELGTHSDHRLLDTTIRDRLLAEIAEGIVELGGRIEVKLVTGLLTARRQ